MENNYNSSMNNEINAAVTRMINFLKNGEYEQADASADYLLHLYPGFGSAYIGKLLAEFHLQDLNDLLYTEVPYTSSDNYKHALYYSDPQTKQFLKTAPYENFYIRAKNKLAGNPTDANLRIAAGMFRQISGYRDAAQLFQACNAAIEKNRLNELYQKAVDLMQSASNEESWQAAADAFACLNGYNDSAQKRNECLQKANEFRMDAVYNSAVDPDDCETVEEFKDSLMKYESITGWKDADEKAAQCRDAIQQLKREFKLKIIKRILVPVGVLLIGFIAYIVIFQIIPLSKYNHGIELLNNGAYTEAAEVFSSLKNFKDSEAKVVEIQSAILEDRYQKALSLMNEGKYSESAEAFSKLDGYKDSLEKAAEARTLILDQQYNDAVQLLSNGQLVEGIEILLKLGDYRDSSAVIESVLSEKAQALSEMDTTSAAAQLEALDPEITTSILERMDARTVSHLNMVAAVVGDVLTFGQYEQDNNLENGQEAVEWIVLDHQKGILTMISRYALDVLPYHSEPVEVTWEDCDLRKWLNDDFYHTAFSDDDRSMFFSTQNENPVYFDEMDAEASTDDLVYLLSVTEAEQYFKTDSERTAEMTVYAAEKGADAENGFASWWLRSPGYDLRNAAYIYSDGKVHQNGIYVFSTRDAVRPVIQIIP